MTWRKIGLLIIFIPPGYPLWPGYGCKWTGIPGNTERLVFRYGSFSLHLTFACNTFTSFSKVGDNTVDIFHFKPRFLPFGESTFFRKAMGGLPSKRIQSSSLVFNTVSSITNYIFRYREGPQCIGYSIKDAKEGYFPFRYKKNMVDDVGHHHDRWSDNCRDSQGLEQMLIRKLI